MGGNDDQQALQHCPTGPPITTTATTPSAMSVEHHHLHAGATLGGDNGMMVNGSHHDNRNAGNNTSILPSLTTATKVIIKTKNYMYASPPHMGHQAASKWKHSSTTESRRARRKRHRRGSGTKAGGCSQEQDSEGTASASEHLEGQPRTATGNHCPTCSCLAHCSTCTCSFGASQGSASG